MRTLQNLTIFLPQKRVGLFGSDWWPATSSAESEGAVFSRLISGGNCRSRLRDNAEGARLPRLQVAEKTSPGASELTESPILVVKNAKF